MNEELKSRARKAVASFELPAAHFPLAMIIKELVEALEAQEKATEIANKARREAVDALRRQSHRISGWC